MVDPAPRSRQNQSSWMRLVTLLLRILLWPLRSILDLLFPLNDFDGLSPAVASKAAEAFSAYLVSVNPTVSQLPWATMGFAACKSEAIHSNAILLIYLHAPLHYDADRVAAKFCREEITNILSLPHVVALGVSTHSAQGAHLSQLLNATAFPLVAMLQPKRGSNSMELILNIQGPVLARMSVGSLVGHLQGAMQRHESALAEAEAIRIQREQENALRAEQDAEYQATLQADRDRQREVEEERERIRREEEEIEAAVQREQQVKTSRLDTARILLKDEPTEGKIAQIRFVLPSGRKVVRKFGGDESVEALRAFLTVHFADNEMPEMPNIGLSTNFPRKSYNENEGMTLQDAGLTPQAVLMVQDLDA